MTRFKIRPIHLPIIAFSAMILSAATAHAWTTPPASPPNSNVSAPINVGATAQTKNGTIGVNGLAVFGDSILQASSYLNWGATSGTSGYGIRDTAGSLEFKNSGGTWQTLQAFVAGLGGTTQWTTSGTSIYYNGGNVGIGSSTPSANLVVAGGQILGGGSSSNWGQLNIGGATSINAAGTIYSYSRICSSNNSGGCDSNGGVVIAGAGGVAAGNVLINALGNSYFNVSGGNVGIGTVSPGKKLDVTGDIRASGEIQSTLTTGSGQIRMISGGYGAFWRNDGINTYLLFTEVNDQYGSWNTLRPVYFENATGITRFGHAVYAPSFLYNSDRRLKEDIVPLSSGLATTMALSPVSFTWKKGIESSQAGEDDIGFIAQEVEKVVPGIVHTDSTGMKSIDYIKLSPILVKAIQEQQKEIDELKAAVRALQEK